jgi:subtilisin family serine protease
MRLRAFPSFRDLTYSFTYDETAAGTGVDVYVVDTGIRTTHVALEGRATWGATFGGYANADGNGSLIVSKHRLPQLSSP